MFQEYNIAALTDILPLLEGFAEDAGWTVGSDAGNPTFTPPGGSTAIKCRYIQTGTGASQRQALFLDMPADVPVISAYITNPRTGTNAAAPGHTQPTKLCLFGDARFIAIVVAYGYNRYRHLYMGVMEHLGDYTGREVISGVNVFDSHSTSQNVSFRDTTAQYLFGATHTISGGIPWNNAAWQGGVHIVHADEPDPWRDFVRPASPSTFSPDFAAGGFKDDVNDGFLARAKSEYAGQHVLTPINLYAAAPSNNWRPLGRPPGVRLVLMEGVDPEQSIIVGTKQWRVFPHSTKRLTPTYPVGDGVIGRYPDEDGSYLVGYAYQEEE